MKPVITWLLFLGVIAVNAMANILPINGIQTGEVSAMFDNYFVPAGFTFSIWGVIYLLLAGYCVTATIIWIKGKDTIALQHLDAINPLFLITCILNMLWMFAWHYLQIASSLIIMIFFLAVLTTLFLRLHKLEEKLYPAIRFWLTVPFVVYLAWICVATIANTSAFLTSIGWEGGFMKPEMWSACMIVIASLLALFFTLRLRVAAFAPVIIWALYGIYKGQQGIAIVTNTAWISLVILAIALAFLLQVRNWKGR
jgi:translocator protein